MQKKLLIFTDNQDNFLISIDNNYKYISMDINRLINGFKKRGYDIQKKKFSEFDTNDSYKDVFVLYHISEDVFTIYKSYVEDIICFLYRQGAVLLPCCDYARAHHNKIYMEMLRSEFTNNELKSIKTKYFGNAIEALQSSEILDYPVVIKIANGAGSRGVALANNKEEFEKKVKKICRGNYYSSFADMIKKMVKKVLICVRFRHDDVDRYFGKIIVQTFVPNLSGDYKVLYFGGKYYTLKRLNRDNDFRASGSGKLFPVPDEEMLGLLEFAQKVVKEIDFPIIGIDIAYDGEKYHLLEFQMIHLGPYTLSMSNYYHINENGKWKKVVEKSNLEEEFVRSIDLYIRGECNER